MKKPVPKGLVACLTLLALAVPGSHPALALDCSVRRLVEAETVVCRDAQLSRTDQQVGGRIKGMARKLSFGQYLGLRYWNTGWSEERGRCGADRTCLAMTYRAQMRFLDRLQQCLDTNSPRRVCLRNTLNVEREAAQRR